ncbi:helix-turn-helix domain-containing protein [Mucilaginibacter sp. X5P1]|uniref:helix-turn-helix domain-containing protein n=1 Tax=Mucilaginibacter sp. X5P1 TaxID=2723088 RepID=UPI00161D96E4|nr:helix-turn-helix domain-containing protein [Mucilaginibacter sp. X5P1]MBB6137512.1 AraC-like DNA-binding protein [Mucilaginibacter sp. X5P1]
MNRNIMKEITPLTDNDCFTIFSRTKKVFDFPLHYHDEYELNLILNGKGVKRIMGNSEAIIDDMELVLVGPSLYHGWFTHECKEENITEVTIQFHKDLFDEKLLNRNQLSLIKKMFDNAQCGILFSQETIVNVADRILKLKNMSGFDSALELMSLLYDLSIAKNSKMLSDPGHLCKDYNYKNEKVEKVFEYLNKNFNKQIALTEMARIVDMSEAAFARFIKKRTGMSFVNILNEIRVGHASKILIDSTNTISEIAYQCGFNNLSYFNRIFKEKKIVGPKEYRKTYAGAEIFV